MTHRLATLGSLLALAALSAACSSVGGPDGSLVYGPVVRRDLGDGLVQRVEFPRVELRAGDTLAVRSVILNTGTGRHTVVARICHLDIRSEAPLLDPFIRCAGASGVFTLGPGDSIVGGDRRLVGPGARAGYPLLRVAHLIEPPVVVEARVRVTR
jgi:hypothetical protein